MTVTRKITSHVRPKYIVEGEEVCQITADRLSRIRDMVIRGMGDTLTTAIERGEDPMLVASYEIDYFRAIQYIDEAMQ